MNRARRNAVSGAPPSLVRPSAVTTTSATADGIRDRGQLDDPHTAAMGRAPGAG